MKQEKIIGNLVRFGRNGKSPYAEAGLQDRRLDGVGGFFYMRLSECAAGSGMGHNICRRHGQWDDRSRNLVWTHPSHLADAAAICRFGAPENYDKT
jgi:hypothetical protein